MFSVPWSDSTEAETSDGASGDERSKVDSGEKARSAGKSTGADEATSGEEGDKSMPEDAADSEGAAELRSASARRTKRRESEEELFRYASEMASVAYLRQALDGLDREAERCIEGSLPRQAYEHAVRMLSNLDRLETRGALEPSQRLHWLTQVRERVAAAAGIYRENFPLFEASAIAAADGPGGSDASQSSNQKAASTDG